MLSHLLVRVHPFFMPDTLLGCFFFVPGMHYINLLVLFGDKKSQWKQTKNNLLQSALQITIYLRFCMNIEFRMLKIH